MTPAILLAATVVAFDVQDDEPLLYTCHWRASLEDGQSLVWREECRFHREGGDTYAGGKLGDRPLVDRVPAFRYTQPGLTRTGETQAQSPGAGATARSASQATSAATSTALIDWTAPACTCRHKEPPEEPTPAVPLPAGMWMMLGWIAVLTLWRKR